MGKPALLGVLHEDSGSKPSWSDAAKANLIAAFGAAYSQTGFGYIKNHGIEPKLLAAVCEASARFHALPLADKMAIELDARHRGYIPINTSNDVNSSLAKVTKPNQSASFMRMREDATERAGQFLSGPRWRPMWWLSDLGRRLMEVALRAASVDPALIMQAFDEPTIWLRLLHYPPPQIRHHPNRRRMMWAGCK